MSDPNADGQGGDSIPLLPEIADDPLADETWQELPTQQKLRLRLPRRPALEDEEDVLAVRADEDPPGMPENAGE
ncbi:hypothetical protein SLUN_01245 [Streptomyces lunaelactis]|uniref:Uncharacterized protein n=1 Tax=Streptomyces lunaelactis TaxID=1535768 RepID=A0A2R4SW30_9ACTN|nr:hypothetical protein [Streptomyces lunaelactis]AVZ71080.1 hypothetical protein SLUN_01245 [Streptomyces lunaelactis]NUK22663.1 hypothetical protein [Streptomyces lunaelactis]NUK88155.1 hypothetical protein [Streptomyces lunaelactis]